MKAANPLLHIGMVIAILVATLLLFTFLPGLIPAPEPISPPTYLVAAAAGFAVLLLAQRKNFWVYLPIPLISLFFFLEEASYGVESGSVEPLIWERHNVQVYDLHNFIGVFANLVDVELARVRWDYALAGQLFLAALVIFGLWLLFLAVYRFSSSQAAKRQQNVAQIHKWFCLLLALAAAGYLLSLPADGRNSFLLGYSLTRLALIAALLAGGLLPFWLWSRPRAKSWLSSSALSRRLLPWALGLLILAGLAFLVWAPLGSAPDKLVLVQRLAPLALWALATGGLSGLSLLGVSGALERFAAWLDTFRKTFFQTHPAYIYAIAAVVLVIFAQAMDQYLISLGGYIPFDNPWGDDWDYWIEETLELCGSYQLLGATAVMAQPWLKTLTKKKRSP